MNYIISDVKIRFNFKTVFKKIWVYIYIHIYFYNVLIYMLLFNKKHRISYKYSVISTTIKIYKY